MNKKIYVALIADLLHSGHIKLLEKASNLGDVTVGLLSQEACKELNDPPFLSYEKRKKVLDSIKYIKNIIPQTEASYRKNLINIKPDFVMHGDDWQRNEQRKYRQEVVNLLRGWKGKLIEVEYSRDISNEKIKELIIERGIASTSRVNRIRLLLESGKFIKLLEVHNALSALIVENIKIKKGKSFFEFDGMWSSSLTDSTSKGKPDIEAVDVTSRLTTINDIFECTTKPLVFDADTGGKAEHFAFTVRSLERTGVSAVVIEDKTGLKKNSLFGNKVFQKQDTINNFCEKITYGKKAQYTKDFMIISRIESLILQKGLNDALKRAFAYVEAGADAIMIHSRSNKPYEIFNFIKKFRSNNNKTPIVVAPTTFNKVKTDTFEEIGANIVIYANHMLRASYPGMIKVAELILKNKRSYEAENSCMTIKKILNLIPGTK